tara:strand:- start:1125 stop:1853 length:729 start_codon:yes stop_codon:yes gene_type:complete
MPARIIFPRRNDPLNFLNCADKSGIDYILHNKEIDSPHELPFYKIEQYQNINNEIKIKELDFDLTQYNMFKLNVIVYYVQHPNTPDYDILKTNSVYVLIFGYDGNTVYQLYKKWMEHDYIKYCYDVDSVNYYQSYIKLPDGKILPKVNFYLNYYIMAHLLNNKIDIGQIFRKKFFPGIVYKYHIKKWDSVVSIEPNIQTYDSKKDMDEWLKEYTNAVKNANLQMRIMYQHYHGSYGQHSTFI